MGYRPPYEDPFDITYIRRSWGLERVRSVRVRPARQHELRLLAEGMAITYHGHVKGDARKDGAEQTEQQKVSEMKLHLLWAPNSGRRSAKSIGSVIVGKE